MNRGRIWDFIIVILPCRVRYILDQAKIIFLVFVTCFSTFNEHTSSRFVEKIIPKMFNGSLDHSSGICGLSFSFEPTLEPI
jgi:hypothetical protein